MERERLAIVYVDQDELGKVLEWFAEPSLDRPLYVTGKKVPPGVFVKYFFLDHSRRAIGFVVEHGSFDVHQPGAELPVIESSGHFRLEVPTPATADAAPAESSGDFFRRVMGEGAKG